MPILLWRADWLQDHFANIFKQTPNLFIGNGSYNREKILSFALLLFSLRIEPLEIMK